MKNNHFLKGFMLIGTLLIGCSSLSSCDLSNLGNGGNSDIPDIPNIPDIPDIPDVSDPKPDVPDPDIPDKPDPDIPDKPDKEPDYPEKRDYNFEILNLDFLESEWNINLGLYDRVIQFNFSDTARPVYEHLNDQLFGFQNSNPDVVSVNQNCVTPLKPGKAEVIFKYESCVKTVHFTVIQPTYEPTTFEKAVSNELTKGPLLNRPTDTEQFYTFNCQVIATDNRMTHLLYDGENFIVNYKVSNANNLHVGDNITLTSRISSYLGVPESYGGFYTLNSSTPISEDFTKEITKDMLDEIYSKKDIYFDEKIDNYESVFRHNSGFINLTKVSDTIYEAYGYKFKIHSYYYDEMNKLAFGSKIKVVGGLMSFDLQTEQFTFITNDLQVLEEVSLPTSVEFNLPTTIKINEIINVTDYLKFTPANSAINTKIISMGNNDICYFDWKKKSIMGLTPGTFEFEIRTLVDIPGFDGRKTITVVDERASTPFDHAEPLTVEEIISKPIYESEPKFYRVAGKITSLNDMPALNKTNMVIENIEGTSSLNISGLATYVMDVNMNGTHPKVDNISSYRKTCAHGENRLKVGTMIDLAVFKYFDNYKGAIQYDAFVLGRA